MQVLLPSAFVVTVPLFLVQSASVVPAAVPILKVFDLVVLTVVAADAPWAVSANAAKATNDAQNSGENFGAVLSAPPERFPVS